MDMLDCGDGGMEMMMGGCVDVDVDVEGGGVGFTLLVT